MNGEADATVLEGEGSGKLAPRLGGPREALLNQLEAIGLTRESAEKWANTYDALPDSIYPQFILDTGTVRPAINNFITMSNRHRVHVDLKLARRGLASPTSPGRHRARS